MDALTKAGVVVGDREYQVDCLIYATGFEVGTDYTRRAGYDVIGSRGHSLSEHWRDGMRSVHGMHVHGFPNMFVLGHTQGGFTVNYPHLLEEASDHLATFSAMPSTTTSPPWRQPQTPRSSGSCN